MRGTGLALLVFVATSTMASGQTPEFRPIDTNRFIVQPVDQATGFLSGATRTLSRVVANAIQSDGIIRTVNNLFGRNSTPAPVMSNGINPAAYPRYQSPLFHVPPTAAPYRR
jgi:hypothetical protein